MAKLLFCMSSLTQRRQGSTRVVTLSARRKLHIVALLEPGLGIRIRIHLAVLYPDLNQYHIGKADPSRIQEHENLPKFTNKPGLLPFKKAFVPS